MNPATNALTGPVVDLVGRAQLLQQAVAQDRHAVAHRHRLGLVVRDVQGGSGDPALHADDLAAHLHPQLGVQVGERLVHQERRRLAHDRAAHRHPLALAARELPGLAVEQLGQAQHHRRLVHPPADLVLRHPRHLEAERHVVAHRHVRVEGVVLEHHRDVAVARRQPGHHPVVDPDLAVGDRLEAGHHPQRGGLAAPGRADQHQELARLHLQAEVVDRDHAAREVLGDRLQRDRAGGGHHEPASMPVMRLFRARASSAGGISASTPPAARIG